MSCGRVGIVVVNWNGTDDTLECLASLNSLSYANYTVYVVDNGSTVSCKGAVESQYPGTQVIELPENRGFAGGVNAAVKIALGDGARYLWLVNNDAVVEPATLTELVKIAEADPRCGIVGCKVLKYGRNSVLDHAGGRIMPWLGRAEHIGMGEEDRGQYDAVRAVHYVTGCSILAKREVFEEVGLLPEDYFLYWEETEWCVRASRRGWKVLYCPTARVYHKVAHTVGQGSPRVTYYFARNSLLFVRRNFPCLLPLAVFWWPRYFLVNHLVKRRHEHLLHAIAGLRDFLLGRFGPMNDNVG